MADAMSHDIKIHNTIESNFLGHKLHKHRGDKEIGGGGATHRNFKNGEENWPNSYFGILIRTRRLSLFLFILENRLFKK